MRATTVNGRRFRSLVQLAAYLRIDYDRLRQRISAGWPQHMWGAPAQRCIFRGRSLRECAEVAGITIHQARNRVYDHGILPDAWPELRSSP